MLNEFAVEHSTLLFNQCFSNLIQFLAECKAVQLECRAAAMDGQAFRTRTVYPATFLQIQLRLPQHLIRQSQIFGALMY